jgi:putative transposase
VTRTVQRDGLHLHNIRYWHPIFSQLAISKAVLIVHYDPRDLSQLYVRSQGETMLAVPYAGLHRPAVSIWECAAAARHLRQLGETKVREARLFAAIEEQRRIIRAAASKTRSARAKQQRRTGHQRAAPELARAAPIPEEPVSTLESQTTEYPGEVW